jgi:hypothetical protein
MAVWLLLVLATGLGQALALAHRVEAGAAAAPDSTHALGGEHHDGDVHCRLADQAGLGDALATAMLALPPSVVPEPEAALGDSPVSPAARRRSYEARAPPRG